jgi:cyclophilin family peptidyl-prolyl cis-trans isomerase
MRDSRPYAALAAPFAFTPAAFALSGCGAASSSASPAATQAAQASTPATSPAAPKLQMARTSDPDSAGSQFCIALASPPQLDGRHTAFGHVIKGMDVVKQIQVGDVMRSVTVRRAQ